MADPTGLSTVLAGKVLDATIGYVRTANRYNSRHKDLEDLVHTTGAFLQACPSGIARPIVQRVFQDVQPLHTGAEVLVRKRQDWEDKTTTFDRQLRLHTRWKLSKDALYHTQKIRTTEADRLPRAILMSVLDLQKELKSLRKDVRDIKSSLGHSEARKQGTISHDTETPKQQKRKHKRRKQKTSKQAKYNEAAAEKGMDTTRADCISHFSRGVRNIQERLMDSIMEVGRDAFSDVIEGAMGDAVNLHLESIRSSIVTSKSCDSTKTRKSFQVGRVLTNAVLPETTGETDHMEAEETDSTGETEHMEAEETESTRETEHMELEETESAEDVGIENEGHQTKMVEVERIQQLHGLHGSTPSQYISQEISYGKASNFTFEALVTATDDFAYLLGQGGSADVYRGCLPDGSRIAVKRIWDDSVQSEQDFWREIRCSFEHPALVKILGWCAPTPMLAKSRWQLSFFSKRKREELVSNSRRKHCIVMEYLEGGSLHDHLFGDNVRNLEWPARLKICIGVASGISFLHKQGIIHRDIKPGNILLDKNFSPKIVDFGISRFLSESTSRTMSDTSSPVVSGILRHTGMESFMSSALSPDFDGDTTVVQGTMGYVDPENFGIGKVGPNCDVYSFGTTLLNVVSGSRAFISSGQEDGGPHKVLLLQRGGPDKVLLLERARILFRLDKVGELIDPKMERTTEDVTDIKEVVRIALLCCVYKIEDRPMMDEVHNMLLKLGNKC